MAERDPHFAEKAVAIIELELHPPADGPTFCVDEKTGIGVRTPAVPGQPVAPTRPARRDGRWRVMSSQPAGARDPVDWARSPTTVIDPDSDRRASMRSCMGVRSCASSTTMWP